MVTGMEARVSPVAEMRVRVLASCTTAVPSTNVPAGAAKSAKGTGPGAELHPGGGNVPAQSCGSAGGGGARSVQVRSRKLEEDRGFTVLTQILEPVAGGCPLMVAVPFTMPTACASSKLCVVFPPGAMVTASCSGSFSTTICSWCCELKLSTTCGWSSGPEIKRVKEPGAMSVNTV